MATSEQREQEQESGSLLMRFFESEFFDAWIAVSYLHKDLSPKTREYLCERIYMLPESEVESYVSQLCQLYVSRQGHEEVGKLLVDLCANSLNIAVKIYWILLAISQDRPHDEAIIQLRDRCELAGLSGHWDLPFKDTALPAPMPRRMNRFLRHSANGVYSADKWSSGQIDPMGASPDGYMERRYSAHSNHDFLGGRESRSISPDGLGAGLFSSVFVDTGVEGLIYESGPHVNDGQPGHKAIRAQEPGSRLNESIESLRSDSSSVTHLVSSKTSPLTLVEAPSSPKRRETTFGATLDFVEALCSASSYLTSFSEEERQWALHKSLRNINVEIDRASSAGVAIWFPMTRAAPQRVIRLAYRESRLLNSREKAPFTLYVEVLNEETSVLEAEGILSPGGGIMDPSRAVSAELDKDTLRSLSRNLDSEAFGFNVKAAAEEAAAAGIPWVPQHHRRNSSHDFSSSNLASIALAAVKGSSAAEKSHLPPVAPNDSLQLTPSVASQKSDASVLAAELSLADFACDSRDGSPSSHISKLGSSDSEIDRGMVHQSVKHLPRLAVQGGGTWIGGISQNPENRYGPHKIVSSPRIQDAMDQIRGEDVAPVSLIIHVFDPKSTGPPKMCTNSGLLCRIGICQCSHAPKQRKLDEDASEDKLVRIELRLKPGLDLTVKPPNSSKHRRMPSREALLQVAKQHKLPPPVIMATIESTTEYDGADSDLKKQGELEKAQEVYGEKWEDRKERIRRKSPHGNRPGWDLRCVIVKSGDDCRQELLSMQLIRTFHSIFLEAGLPLWLRPYEVLVTSNLTALIEMVPNAPSIHQVKSSFSNQNKSLRDHFMIMYGRNTPEFELAQNNFVESMAAYSLVCYLLQIRDRHNGNLLLDNEGHIIHIDFGFMLSNSPGGVNFESAPFKLTRELLEIMDSDSEGTSSKSFDYFKVLMIQGFIAIRKHADRLLELVSMMSDSGCPCFKNKGMAVEGLRKRLAPGISEEALVKHVLGLIGDSLDAWRTRQYDYYQRVLNGIM